MARRTFDVIDVAEILVPWHAGRSTTNWFTAFGCVSDADNTGVLAEVARGLKPGRRFGPELTIVT